MIRGQKRQLAKAPEIKTNLNACIHNRFDIEVIDAQTGKIKQRAQAENVICSQLWARLFTPAAYFTYIHYGTGNGTPATTDTSLFTFLGYGTPSYTDDILDIQAASGVVSYRRKIRLGETTAVGSTLTEVGIGYGTAASTLCTHAMLKDANGNQISIAKTSTDIINIFATVFLYWPASGYDSGHIKFVPYLYKYSSDSFPLTGFCGMLLGVYFSSMAQAPTGMQPINGCYYANKASFPTSSLTVAYSKSNKTITLTAARLAAASCNYGGFGGILIFDQYAYKSSIWLNCGGTWFPHSSITGEEIGTGDGTTTDFATDFPFPYDATVYVDGVAKTSGVTITSEPLLINDMGQFFIGLNSASTSSLHIPAPELPALSTIRNEPLASGKNYIYYNPNYSVGISSFYRTLCAVSVSNDLITWTQIATAGSGTINVDAAYQNYKYWRFAATDSGYVQAMTAPSSYVGKPIHFNSAPASGAVITANYKTPCVAKDSNHVFDLTVTITLGEYAG